jgi:hypothetical protein
MDVMMTILYTLTCVSRLLTDRIVDRHDPEYHIILWIGSGSHSDFKFARNDRNGNPLEGHRSDPLEGHRSDPFCDRNGLNDNDLQL